MDSLQTKETLIKIRNLVAESDLNEAFEALIELGENLKIPNLNNEATILSGKFSGLEKDFNSGLIKYEDLQLEKIKTTKALTILLDQVENGSIKDSPLTVHRPSKVHPTPQSVVSSNQSVSKVLDYVFIGLVITLFLTCIGGLLYTFISSAGTVFTGAISMTGIFGCLFSLNSWRSKLGVIKVLNPITT